MRILLFCIWILFLLYSFFLAPGTSIREDRYFSELISMQSDESSLMMMFSLLGIWPIVFGALLLRQDTNVIPAWPFVLGSFALGAFALLPYFFLKKEQTINRNRTLSWLQRFLKSRLFYIVITILTVAIVFEGVWNGNFRLYLEAFMSSHFVHVMTIDFIVLTFLSVWAIFEETNSIPRSLLGLIPIFGSLYHLFKSR